jgi:transposase
MASQRPRRTFTDEFRQGAVDLVTQQGYSVHKAAQAVDVHETVLRDWLDHLAPDWQSQRALRPGAAQSDDPQVLRQRVKDLEKANAELRLERDILKKATAYFARESR